MLSFALKRGFFALLLLFFISFGVFALMHFSKASPAYANNPQNVSIKSRQILEANLGLDKPLLEQYSSYMANLFKGDFALSLTSGQEVLSLIKEPFFNTLILALVSLFILSLLALFLAILSIYFKDSLFDSFINFLSLSFFALPSFALSLCLVLFFAVFLQILPSSGAYDIGFKDDLANRASHLILPSLALVLSHLAVFVRFIRTALLDTLHQNFILAAFARGLSKKRIYFYLVPLHSLAAILTYFSASFVSFISNSYIVEAVFLYDGIGNLMLKSILFKDYPVLLPIVLLTALLVFLMNFISEFITKLIHQRQNNV